MAADSARITQKGHSHFSFHWKSSHNSRLNWRLQQRCTIPNNVHNNFFEPISQFIFTAFDYFEVIRRRSLTQTSLTYITTAFTRVNTLKVFSLFNKIIASISKKKSSDINSAVFFVYRTLDFSICCIQYYFLQKSTIQTVKRIVTFRYF